MKQSILDIKREARQHLRLEWYGLYLLDADKKTPAVRHRMAAIVAKHNKWR